MLSAAEYKTNFDTNTASAAARYGTAQDQACAFNQIASVWSFLYIEKSRMDKEAWVPSTLAQSFSTQAETLLGQARTDVTIQASKAVARVQAASNYAYLFVEQVRVDNQVQK